MALTPVPLREGRVEGTSNTFQNIMKNRLQALIEFALIALLSIAFGGCATQPAVSALPIVLIHGDSESAAAWQDVVWRFESNGWPRERLFVASQPFSRARDDDAKGQPGRSANAEHAAFVKAEVDRALAASGAKQVVLIGRGRGALAARTYIQTMGGDKTVYQVVFAQPDALWTGIQKPLALKEFDDVALKGVKGLVLPQALQRDGAFSPGMFAATYAFITARAPATTAITPQTGFELAGQVTGMGLEPRAHATPDSHFYNNLPLPGARVEVYAVHPDSGLRVGNALHQQAVGEDGRFGPFAAQAGVFYEFVVRASGYAAVHIYRSPFLRGSNLVHLKASRIADADLPANVIVELERLRGTLDPTVQHSVLDGQSPPPGTQVGGVNPATSHLTLSKRQNRAIAAELHTTEVERVVGRTWGAKDNQVVRLELAN